MFRVNCPKCGLELEVQEEWIGMECSCPCGAVMIISAPQSESAAPKRKKWLIPAVAGAAVLIVAVILLIVLLPGKEKAVPTPAAEKVPEAAPEEVSIDEQIKEQLRAASPDLARLAKLIAKADNQRIYERAFLKAFDQQLASIESAEARMQLFDDVVTLRWSSITQRYESYQNILENELRNAIAEMNFGKIKKLLPAAEKAVTVKQLVRQGKILVQAEPLLLRNDPAELRNFIDNCPDADIKERLKNRMQGRWKQRIYQLNSGAMRALSRGELQEAEKALAEMKSIDPEDRTTVDLQKRIDDIKQKIKDGQLPPPRQAGPRSASGGRPPHMRGGRGGHRMPLHIQLTRACMMGQREEVIRLMEQKPDLHQIMRIKDGATGKISESTVFRTLLGRGKSMSGSRKDAFNGCLVVILESGFVPSEDEKNYMKEFYPELLSFIK